MEFEAIKRLVQGERLGKGADSALSVLHASAQALSRVNPFLGPQHVDETKDLERRSKALRLGGACEHGADKGLQCGLCKGQLAGPYAQLPLGLEVAEFAQRQLPSSRLRHALDGDIDRINATLREVDALLKQITREQVAEFHKRQRVRKPAPVPELQSISKIKAESGVKFAQTQTKFVLQVTHNRLEGAEVQVELDLGMEDDEQVFEGLTRQIEAKQLECFGRRLVVSALTSPHQTPLRDSGQVTSFFDDYEKVQGDVFVFDFHAPAAHDPIATSYGKCCNTLGLVLNKRVSAALAKNEDKVVLAYKSYALDAGVFEALRFRASLVELNLNHTRFDLQDHCHAIATLVHLQRLSLAKSPLGEQEDDLLSLSIALEVWKNAHLPDLQVLDISNWRLVKSKALPRFASAWKGFMTRRTALTGVKMNRCLFLQPNSFLSDEQLEDVSQFASGTLAESLGAVRELEFDANCFFQQAGLLPRLLRLEGGKLSLNGCRTLDEYESDGPLEECRQRLLLDNNELIGLTSSLVELRLGGCALGDQALQQLCQVQFPHLRLLDVSENEATSRGLAVLFANLAQRFPSLQSLRICGNCPKALVGEAMPRLGSLTELKMQGLGPLDTASVVELCQGGALERLCLTQYDERLDYHAVFTAVPSLHELTVFTSLPPSPVATHKQTVDLGKVTLTRELIIVH